MRYGNHIFCVFDNGKFLANKWSCYNCKITIINSKDRYWAWYIFKEHEIPALTIFSVKRAPLTCEEVLMNEALE